MNKQNHKAKKKSFAGERIAYVILTVALFIAVLLLRLICEAIKYHLFRDIVMKG